MGQCYFSGSNSGEGFHNYFDGVVPSWERLNRYFMIKGGPGVGKSTLMKRVAAKAEEAGEEVEFFYCSGDPDSLDAVRLVKRGIVFADATSPHTMDPRFPGAVEEIVNLGEQIDRNRIIRYRDEVETFTKRNSRSYGRGYAFLRAAKALEEERYREITDCVDFEKIAKLGKDIAARIGKKEERQSRRLFLEALSCKGRVGFAKEHCEGNRVYRVLGEEKDVVTDLLAGVIEHDRKELFCSPLCPNRVNHLLLREQEMFLTTSTGTDGVLLSAEEFLKKDCHELAERYSEEARRLEALAMNCFKECKRIHDDLEKIYRECVDFSAITERTERLLDLLWEL